MSQIEEIRTAADIVSVVSGYVKLRKAGVNLIGLCPFHHEKTPSFAVHPTKQIFHCFGCGVGGDVFKFVMLIESVSFPEALQRVAEKTGVPFHKIAGSENYNAEAKERSALYKIHEVAAVFFAAQLTGTAEGRAARAYLIDRGLADDVVGRFRLGYAPSGGQALSRHLLGTGFSQELLEKSGLAWRNAEQGRVVDRFRRRIIYPIGNESGKTIAFGGRALGDDQPKYLNSPETPVYRKSRVLYNLGRAIGAIRREDLAVLVEGYMDCIAVASTGVDNVVASCGTSLTESHIQLLARFSRKVVVNYDPDSAGIAATERSLALLLEAGFEVNVLALPGGLDPDSFIRQRGAAPYKDLLSAAPSYLDYLTERAASEYDFSRPEGKVAAVNKVLPYLASVASPILRRELAARLAVRLRLDEPLLRRELENAVRERRRELKRDTTAVEVNHAVKQLLRACLESEDVADEFAGELVDSGDCEGLAGEEAFRKIAEFRRQGEKIDIGRLAELLSPAERRLVYDSLFWEGKLPDRDAARDFRLALGRRREEREREKLQAALEEATRKAGLGALPLDLLRAKFEAAKKRHTLRTEGARLEGKE